jgi:uncharacterized membrane protein
MHKTVLIGLLILLALFGVADSWYIAQNESNQTALTCNIQGLDGCNVVAQSQYSSMFGVPLAVYGVGFYALLFVLVAFLAVIASRVGYEALIALSSAGAIASLVFLFIQLVIIQAICIYCIASAITSFLFCGLSFWLFKRFAPPRLAVIA